MHVETTDAGRHTEVVQNAWLQGEKGKLTFDEGLQPEDEIDADGFGAVAYRVDGSKHRTSRIVVAQHPAASSLPGAISNVVTTKVTQERGPILLGHPTTHFRYISEFDYIVDGLPRHATMSHEVWVASDLADTDLLNWMMFEYRLRQDRGVEGIFRQVSTLCGGLPLAYSGLALVPDADGNTHVVRVDASVDSVDRVNVDPSVFTAGSNTYEVIAGGN